MRQNTILNAKQALQQQQEQLHKIQQQKQKPSIRVQDQQQVPPPLPTHMPSNMLQHRNNAPLQSPSRRQDLLSDVLPSAAVGALASGLTPISIFSNLLNAYATLDNKHDITGKALI